MSKKTGKPGYAPACDNKWEPALCLLRTGGRCSDCVNQAFVPVSDHIDEDTVSLLRSIATGAPTRYIGEGFDDPRLDTLFLAMPVSWKRTLIQYSGRLHRHHPSKTEVRIYGYVDREVPMLLRMFEKRVTAYRAIGYARGEAPRGFAEPPNEHTVEYDEEALRHLREDE